MKNFEVHELVDGWTGQAGSPQEAIELRDRLIRDYGAENVEVKITAEIDESDASMWTREDVQRVLFHVVSRYQAAIKDRGTLFDEFLHSAIVDVAIPTLKDNNWWPDES